MLDELISKYEAIFKSQIPIHRIETATLSKMMYKDLEKLKQFQKQERQKVFSSEQEKEIRKYIKDHIDIETTEVIKYGGYEISTKVRVRKNQRGIS